MDTDATPCIVTHFRAFTRTPGARLMPYDPRKPEIFRGILVILRKDFGLSSQKAITLLMADRRGKHDLAPLDLTAGTLDRFKRGDRVLAVYGLGELWKVLEGNQLYRDVFIQAETELAVDPPAVALSSALIRFFSESPDVTPSFSLGRLRDKLVGTYVMYRWDWRPGVSAGFSRMSLVCVGAAGRGLSITEEQELPKDEATAGYQQNDTGFMFPFGNYVYFLMKEDDAGTAVRLGLTNKILPYGGNRVVDSFQGIVFVSSRVGIFPLSKFFCRRIRSRGDMKFGVLKTKDIPDPEARAYLLTSWRDEP